MTPLKRIIPGVIALVAIILVVCVFAVQHIDLSRYKHRIEQLVLDKSGRQMQINGPVNASVFPWMGVRLQDVTLGNVSDFSDVEFASALSSEIQLEFLSFLTGNLSVKSLKLQGLSLNLRRNTEGKTNWDDLLSNTTVVETESDGDVVQEVEAGAPVAAALSVGGLHIIDSNFSYSDELDDIHFALSEFNLSTGTVVLSEPFDFDSQFNFVSGDDAGFVSEVSMAGDLALNVADNVYHLQQFQLSTVNVGGDLPLEQLPVMVEGDLIARLNEQTIDINITGGSVLEVPVSGEIQIDGLQEKGWLTGKLSSGDFNISRVREQLGFEPLALDATGDDFLHNANLSVNFVKFEDQLNISRLNVVVGDVEAEGSIQVANLTDSSVLSGDFETDTFNPVPWARYFGLPVNNALHTARLDFSVRQSGQLLAFNQLSLQLNDSEITGDIEIADINAAVPPVNFALAIDQIDLDRYLRTDEAVESVENNQNEVGSNLPVQLLRELTLSGEVTIGELTIAGIAAQNAVLPILANDGKVELKDAKADLYTGSFYSTASLDVQADEPLFTLISNLNGVSVEPLLQDHLQQPAAVTGIANINIDLLSRGFNRQQLLERSNGAVSARLTDGVVNGIDIASELQQASGVTTNGLIDALTDTPFSELSVSALLAEGVMQSDDLVFNSPLLSMSGEGGINLAKHTVDYLLHIVVSESQDESLSRVLQEFAGIELSVPVQGPFDDLSVDIPSLLQNALKSGLAEQFVEYKNRLSDPLKTDDSQRIESEKEALRERLEQERQDAAELIRENKQLTQEQIEAQKIELHKQLEREKDALKEKLEDNLKKGLGDFLGEN